MDHTTFHNFEQVGFNNGVWPTCFNECVYLFRICRMIVGGKSKQEVHVGKSVFLKFDGVNIADGMTEDVVVCQLFDQGGFIYVEDAHCKVRMISSWLMGK